MINLLWDYRTDNNNTILFGATSVILNDSVENYDKLFIELFPNSTYLSSQDYNETAFVEVPINQVVNAHAYPNNFWLATHSDWNDVWYISGDILKCVNTQATINGLVRVYGIKGASTPTTKLAGDIMAIGDWFKGSRYSKSDIDYFFMKCVNEGLSAYEITFYGEPGKSFSIIGGTSRETYNLKLNDSGVLTRLLFFDLGESITITYDESITRIVVLSDRKASIVLPNLYDLIPVMTSDTTPSGECICSSKLNNNFEAYYAFNQIDCDISTLQGCWLAHNSDTDPYLIYDFGSPVYVKSLSLDVVNNGPTVQKRMRVEGSIDGETYHNILSGANYILQTFTRAAHERSFHDLNWELCKYIRIRGVEPFYGGANQYACGFNAVQVTGMYL